MGSKKSKYKVNIIESVTACNREKKITFLSTQEFMKDNLENIKSELESLSPLEISSLILASFGKDASKMLAVEIINNVIQILPFLEPALHLIIISPASSGKTFMYSRILKKSRVLDSGITEASLFGHANKEDDKGVIATNDIIAIDDVQAFSSQGPLLGKLLGFMANGNCSRGNSDNEVSDCSILFLANYSTKTAQILKNDPYNLKEINLLEPFIKEYNQDNFKSRVIYLPIYLGRDLAHIVNSDVEAINIHELENYFDSLRKLKLDFNFSSDYSQRQKNNIYSLTNGFLKLLYPLRNYSEFEKDAFVQLMSKFSNLLFNKKNLKLIGTAELNWIWITFSEHLFPYPKSSLIESYVDKDRIMLKFNEEPEFFFKIATTEAGINKNKKEVSTYNKSNSDFKSFLSKTEKYDDDFIILKCFSPGSPIGTSRKFDLELLSEKKIKDENLKLLEKIEVMEQKIDSIDNNEKYYRNIIKKIVKDLNDFNKITIPIEYLMSPQEKDKILIENSKSMLSNLSKIPENEIFLYNLIRDKEERSILFFNYDFLEYVEEISDEKLEILKKKYKN